MKHIILLMALICMGHAFRSGHDMLHHGNRSSVNVPNNDAWELVKNEAGIAVYSREISGRDYLEYKGVTRFNASMAGVVSLLEDISSYPSWLYTCRQARVLKTQEPGQRFIHFVYDVPVYSNRDAVMHSCAARDRDGNSVTMKFRRVEFSRTKSLFDGAKITRDDDNEYVKQLSVSWQLNRVGNEVEVTYIIYLDPDIGFPGSLRVNATTEGLIFESLKKMRTKLNEAAYRNAAPKVVALLPTVGECW